MYLRGVLLREGGERGGGEGKRREREGKGRGGERGEGCPQLGSLDPPVIVEICS